MNEAPISSTLMFLSLTYCLASTISVLTFIVLMILLNAHCIDKFHSEECHLMGCYTVWLL
jgi:uncharacterized membrane protein